MSTRALERAVIGWNRSRLDLDSDEVLAQVLDRGDLAAWRELYALAASDPDLRRRILGVVGRVPLPFPGFYGSSRTATNPDYLKRAFASTGTRSVRLGLRLSF